MIFNQYFKDSKTSLKESHVYIILMIGLFVFGGFVGYLFSPYFTFLDELLEQLLSDITGMNVFEIILYIFHNNARSSLSALLFGLFLGIMPVFAMVVNGILVGYVFSKAVNIGGYGVFWRLVPHGVFELPAIFISAGMGFWLGMALLTNRKKDEMIRRLKLGMHAFILIVLPLLVVAAIIEGILIAFAS